MSKAKIESSEYFPLERIREQAGAVSRGRLAEWHQHGWIRSVKLGACPQAGRLYDLGDVRSVLEALAAGRTPEVVVFSKSKEA